MTAKRIWNRDMLMGMLIVGTMIQVSAWIPLLGFLIAMLLPAPVIYYRLKRDPITALAIAGAGSVASPVINGQIGPDQLIHASLLAFGILVGQGWARKAPRESMIARAILMVLAGATLTIFLKGWISDTGFLPLVEGYVRASLELSLHAYREMGVPPETVELFEESLPQIGSAVTRLLPAIATTVLMISAWISILVVREQARRLALEIPDIGVLIHWRIPESVVWGVIGCGTSLMFPIPILRIVALSGLMVLLTLYLMQGAAVLGFWLDKRQTPRWLWMIIIAMILFQQLLLITLMVIGLFDTWFDFRKRIETKP